MLRIEGGRLDTLVKFENEALHSFARANDRSLIALTLLRGGSLREPSNCHGSFLTQ